MTDLKSMTPEELTAWCREQGQPAFRGRQLFQWLSRGVVSTQEMTDLPKALRASGATMLLNSFCCAAVSGISG